MGLGRAVAALAAGEDGGERRRDWGGERRRERRGTGETGERGPSWQRGRENRKTSGATGRHPAFRRLQKRAAHEESAAAHAEAASSAGPREGASSA